MAYCKAIGKYKYCIDCEQHSVCRFDLSIDKRKNYIYCILIVASFYE